MRGTGIKALLLIGLILTLAVCATAHNFSEKDQMADLQAKIEANEMMGSLPIELTPEEMTRLDEIGIGHRATAPPVGPARNPAEWEPMTGAIIRWPLGIPVSLIAEMSDDLEIYTIVANSSQQASATSTYQSGGVNMANAFFIMAPTNSIWTRDYGPWFIFDGAGNYGIVDPVYNRPRPLDDLIPGVIGTEWGVPVYGMDLTTAGGNHMSDGLGTSMSTRLVYDENPGMAPRDVDAMMKDYLGNDYTVLEYIESGGIHHIDCWAKFLDPTTILVKDVSPGHPSYSLLNARAAFLATQTSSWGEPYTVVRVYCPYGTAY
ncbi:MAG: agmatine deiminase family protein, partial [Candidatus Zixiibacteriota bacterium]